MSEFEAITLAQTHIEYESWKLLKSQKYSEFYHKIKLGEKGKFAIVKRARHLLTGEDVAIKVIDKDKIDEISRLHIHKEVKRQ